MEWHMTDTHYVVMYSGGITSWAAGKRIATAHGVDNMTLLFADTLIEDADLYRFLDEAAANIGVPVTRIADGRTPWEIFREKRYLGNTRVDPCSKILKRDLIARWLDDNCDKPNTQLVFGFDWMEGHRLERMNNYNDDWLRIAPLLEKPLLTKTQVIEWLVQEGIEPPRLYAAGFAHNNCGGTCVKAGQAAWALVLKTMPERYREWENNEEELRQYLDKDISILKDRRGEGTKPLTLQTFRHQLEAQQAGQPALFDTTDWGSCGCFQVADDGTYD